MKQNVEVEHTTTESKVSKVLNQIVRPRYGVFTIFVFSIFMREEKPNWVLWITILFLALTIEVTLTKLTTGSQVSRN